MAEKLSSNDLTVLKEFGSNLKSLLKSKKLTQKDFAKEIGVAPYTVSLWVNGKANITLTFLYKIVDYFHDEHCCGAISELCPDWINYEHIEQENEQLINGIKRLNGLPHNLKIELIRQLGIKRWNDLFEAP